ncbi:raffinose/stachyose/melibiose transport system substrate-binding protein [Gracilibacillus halotolerans]|uniref:Raffinose/stachyose/melibiose transport system substrate-binding protein n=1 Tax=Gracilibacillus halotolerans TaxID=74386 RepID=A0A841RR89_9BACI|nr:ABC transporter substrate-binding protein [Gracilibacillus halotolerans]MBB6514337.1 raffinose/stachyose/melibiose transport system substrate-binding protein [Gracilibacillus halotolerans]
MIKLQNSYYVALIFGLALFLIGCQDAEDVGDDDWVEDVSSPTETEEDTELILRHAIESEEEINILRDAIENVESNINATITMNPQGAELYHAILEEEIEEGGFPHIIEVIMAADGPFIKENREHFLDLTDYLEEIGLKDSFYSLDGFTIDGRIYGLPVRGVSYHLFYNKELVEELGGVPATWDDLVTLMKEASQAGYNPLMMDAQGYRYLDLFEGLLPLTVSEEKLNELINGEASWTDEEFIRLFESIEEITQLEIPVIETESEGDPTQIIESFLTGDSVFIYTNHSVEELQEGYPQMDGNIGVMSIPSVAGFNSDSSSFIHGHFMDGFAFSADVTTEEEEMIYEFIEAFWTEEVISNYSVEFGYLPSMRMDLKSTNELLQDITNLNNEATRVYPSISTFFPYDYEREILLTLQGVATGNKSANESVERLQHYHENYEETE